MSASDAALLHDEAAKEDILTIWTVTTGTADFGSRFVARPHFIGGVRRVPIGPLIADTYVSSRYLIADTYVSSRYLIADTLEEVREMLPHGLSRLN